MTPRETVETALRAYARRDMQGALSLFHPDLDFDVHPTNERTRMCGCFKGLPAFQDHLAELDRDWAFDAFEPQEIIADGPRVAARIRIELTERATGESFVTEIVNFMTVEEGRITKLQEFRDTAMLEGTETGSR